MTDPFSLPAPCLERILQRQDPLSEVCFPWGTFRRCRPLTVRLVSRQARQAVHDTVRALVLEPQQRDQDKVTSLPAWLPQCWQLQQLICDDTTALTDLHGLPSSLQVLELSRCYALTDFSALRACTGLRELVLGGEAEALEPPPGAALVLRICRPNSATGTDSPEVPAPQKKPWPWVTAAAPTLSQLTALTSLQLVTKVEHSHSEAAGQLAKAIGGCSGLRALRLGVSGLRYMVPRLGEALPQLQHLTLLDLSGSSKTNPVSAAWLAPCLPHLTALHTLDLQHAFLNADDDLTALATSLQAHPSLRTLNLQSTGVRADAALAAFPSAIVSEAGIDRNGDQRNVPSDGARLVVLCTMYREPGDDERDVLEDYLPTP